jgi:putative ABC transport system permease protein
MLLREYFASVFESLFLNKMRTALAALGIIIGIAAVVSLLSIGESNKLQIESQVKLLGTNLVTVASPSQLTIKDLESIKNSPALSLQHISPELAQQTDVVYGKKTKSTPVVGVTSGYMPVHNIDMQSGTFINDEGLVKNAKTAVLGPELAKFLFGSGVDPIGSSITIKGQNYKIIGVTKAKGGDAYSSPDYNVFVPLSAAQNRLFGTKNFSSVALSLTNSNDAVTAKAELLSILLANHHITNPDDADFQIQSLQDLLKTLSGVSNSVNNLLTTIAAISLIVGGIGIMNVMLVTVVERTSEIGLRKAVGATRKAIVAQFLGEAIVLTSLGGIFGVLGGYVTSLLILSVTSQPYAFSTPAVGLALIMSTGIGLLFGWYPAWKASKLSPIEALRYE